MELYENQVERCHRIEMKSNRRPIEVNVKFRSYDIRLQFLYSRQKRKQTEIVLKEGLTSLNLFLIKKVREYGTLLVLGKRGFCEH